DLFSDHLLDELMHRAGVGADGGRSPVEGGLAEAGEVEGKSAVTRGDPGPHGHPVERRAAEAVDHEERPAGAAEVEVMNGTVDVRDLMPHCVKDPTPGSQTPGVSGSRRQRMRNDAHPC